MMDELLVKYLLNEASPEESGKVIQWIEADTRNRQYFEQFKTIWDNSRELVAGSVIDEDKAWGRFKERVTNPAKTSAFNKPWLRLAASVVIIAAIGLIGYLLLNNTGVKQLAIASGQTVMIDTLSDGSVITLNKTSSLSYPSKFKGNTRTVALKGEAFFNISPDKKKPFIINVDSIQVTVVGTSFNIKEEDKKTEIVVETGIVKVSTPTGTIQLTAGEKTVIGNTGTLEKEKVTDRLYNYYRSREFVCDDTPLWKLAEVIGQAYNVNIVFGRKELRDLPMNTTFNNESLDQVLNVISLTFDIRVTRDGNNIILE